MKVYEYEIGSNEYGIIITQPSMVNDEDDRIILSPDQLSLFIKQLKSEAKLYYIDKEKKSE